jgi:hypothetical protein
MPHEAGVVAERADLQGQAHVAILLGIVASPSRSKAPLRGEADAGDVDRLATGHDLLHRHLVGGQRAGLVGADHVAAPNVSTAGRRRMMALRLAMRLTPTARVMLITAGSPSGMEETAEASAKRKIS